MDTTKIYLIKIAMLVMYHVKHAVVLVLQIV